MEIRVEEFQMPQAIKFNYEDLKQELMAKVSMYETLVYTEDQIKDAKADRAELNKLKKTLNDERIRREKEYMIPFNAFKDKVNEIISIIDKPVGIIDRQVKEYEEKAKSDKQAEIEEMFNGMEHSDLELKRIFSSKWLNATTSLTSIKTEIQFAIDNYLADLNILSKLPAYSFEATDMYKSTLNLQSAIAEANRLAELDQRRKAMEEAKALEQAKAEEVKEPAKEETPEEILPTFDIEERKQTHYFEVSCTDSEREQLLNVLDTMGITYKEM